MVENIERIKFLKFKNRHIHIDDCDHDCESRPHSSSIILLFDLNSVALSLFIRRLSMTNKMEKELMLISWWSRQEKTGRDMYVTMMPQIYANNLIQTQRVLMTASAMGCGLSVSENVNFVSRQNNEKFSFSIVEICGSDKKAICTCNRLISKYFPLYSLRLECENGPFFMDNSAKVSKTSKIDSRSLYRELKAAQSINPTSNENCELRMIAKDILSSIDTWSFNGDKKDAFTQCLNTPPINNHCLSKNVDKSMRLLKRKLFFTLKQSRRMNDKWKQCEASSGQKLTAKCLKTIYKMYALRSLPLAKPIRNIIRDRVKNEYHQILTNHRRHNSLQSAEQMTSNLKTHQGSQICQIKKRSFSDPYAIEGREKCITTKIKGNLRIVYNANESETHKPEPLRTKPTSETPTSQSISLHKHQQTIQIKQQPRKDDKQPIPKPRGENKEVPVDGGAEIRGEDFKDTIIIKEGKENPVRRKLKIISNIDNKGDLECCTKPHKTKYNDEKGDQAEEKDKNDLSEVPALIKESLFGRTPKPKPRVTTMNVKSDN